MSQELLVETIRFKRYAPNRVYWVNTEEQTHRDNDLPAVIFSDGNQQWWVNGKLHRDNDLPAAIFADGTQQWRVNGKLHRDNDLPAVIFSVGNQQCWVNGQRIK